MAALTLCLASPAFARPQVVTTSSGNRTFVRSNHYRPYCRGSGVSWSIGIGFPFYGGYYGGYPYSYGAYPYSYGGYPYSYGAYPYYGGYYQSSYYPYASSGYGGGYYSSGARYYGRPGYERGYRGSTVARVQERLARAGYYRGSIDGIMGPRTRSAIRVYERRHGLPADGVIDRQLLETMGLA